MRGTHACAYVHTHTHTHTQTHACTRTHTRTQDEADIPIRDIVHDTKSGQVEERNTFLGLDSNRLCR